MDNIRKEDWGSESWSDAHFPAGQLDTDGDTWGFRWRGREKWRYKVYLNQLTDVLRKEQPQTVLDIGCALCDFTHKAWSLNKTNKFSGMDISPTAIEWGQKNFPDFELQTGAIPDIPFEKTFNVILCLEVLCYLDTEGRRACLQNIRDKLEPGGIVMLSGVLDGGEVYHSTPEMLSLVRDGYEINKVIYNHWSTYRKWIEEPLDAAQSRFAIMSNWIDASDQGFHAWCAEKDGSAKVKIAKAMRTTSPLSKWLIKSGSATSRFLASRTFPPMLSHAISQATRDNERADEIIVIATKI